MLLFGNFFETNKDQISYETYNNKCNSCTITHITTYSDLLWVEIAWESHNKKDRLHKNCRRTARYHSRKLYQYMSEGKKDQDLYIVNGWTPATPFSSCLFEVSLVIFGQVFCKVISWHHLLMLICYFCGLLVELYGVIGPCQSALLILPWTMLIWCHPHAILIPFGCHSDGSLMSGDGFGCMMLIG